MVPVLAPQERVHVVAAGVGGAAQPAQPRLLQEHRGPRAVRPVRDGLGGAGRGPEEGTATDRMKLVYSLLKAVVSELSR